jgi:hypothetical protein
MGDQFSDVDLVVATGEPKALAADWDGLVSWPDDMDTALREHLRRELGIEVGF